MLEDARIEVHKLIENLKASCLLLDSEMDGRVKIHDVVHNVAASIASRAQLAFKKVGGGLKECQNMDINRSTRILCDVSEFPLRLQCPEIEFFCSYARDRPLMDTNSFLEGIMKLQVLNFTRMHFSSLPPSLGFPTSLHSLCLKSCILHYLSVIMQLKNLEIPSLVNSEIVELPRDLTQLTELKLLDPNNCSKLEFRPENAPSQLSLLQEPHMRNSFVSWEVKWLDNQSNIVSLSELEHLFHLTNLEIDVPDVKKLLNNVP